MAPLLGLVAAAGGTASMASTGMSFLELGDIALQASLRSGVFDAAASGAKWTSDPMAAAAQAMVAGAGKTFENPAWVVSAPHDAVKAAPAAGARNSACKYI